MKPSRATRAGILAVVILMHIAPFIELPKGSPKQPPVMADVSYFVDAELLPKNDRATDAKALRIDCPKTYVGIGIKRNVMNRVLEVAPGWPAHRAGILPGDILSPWDLGEGGGYFEFTVTRNGKTVQMRLKTEDICYSERVPF